MKTFLDLSFPDNSFRDNSFPDNSFLDNSFLDTWGPCVGLFRGRRLYSQSNQLEFNDTCPI